MVCAVIICAVYNFLARYVLLVFLASGLLATNALSLSYGKTNTTLNCSQTDIDLASSTFGTMPNEGNLAQIYGAYLFPSTDAPKCIIGFSVISAICALGVVTYAALHITVRRWPLRGGT